MRADKHLQQQIQAYDEWKSGLIDAIGDLKNWIDEQNLDEDGTYALRVYESIEALNKDRLNVAFVAEFSRGKTELINAIFFADYKRRLLPSEAGRTTMCPTELFYDRQTDQAYIRLLPIETRLEDTSISEYKDDPINWTNIPLDIESGEEMEKAMHEVIKTKEVSIREAERLGLYSKELYPHLAKHDPETTKIEIPKWRHALISFPHPLLKRGLVILDTPGLNALGSEPELTMNMLPAAHAVMFVLAADTGVTRSDLDMWQFHVNGARRSRQEKGIAVVLNKIDTLWDELKNEDAINQTINSQVQKTATMLGIRSETIFPVSAHKGLLAKVKQDPELEKKSRLNKLESYLCNDILPTRESILRDNITGELGSILESNREQLAARLEQVVKQLNELRGLSGKNTDVITHLMQKTREEQTIYNKHVEAFQSSNRLLQRQAGQVKTALNLNRMDKLISESRETMMGSWTTGGLKKGMKNFFDGIQEITVNLADETETLHRLVLAVYKKFQHELGLKVGNPKTFNAKVYLDKLEELYEEAEAFRKSPVTTMTEQSFVVKKFFINLVSQARNIIYKANEDLDNWLKRAVHPLLSQIKDQKTAMEKRLTTLRKINQSRDSLGAKLGELETEHAELKKQLGRLDDIHHRLFKPIPYEASDKASSAA